VENTLSGPTIRETLFSYLFGFYITRIEYLTTTGKLKSPHALWHDRLGHSGSLLRCWILKTIQTYLKLDTRVSRDAAASTSTSVHLGTNMPTVRNTCHGLAICVLKVFYGLKQNGRVWYHRFTDEMIALRYTHDDIAPCIFIKHQADEMVIIAIYIDDLNIIETLKLVDKTIEILNKTFKMKVLENQVLPWFTT
jgi:hypothetical protein